MKCFCCFFKAGLKTTVAHENVTMTGWHCYQCADKAKERLHQIVNNGGCGSLKAADPAKAPTCRIKDCSNACLERYRKPPAFYDYCGGHICHFPACGNGKTYGNYCLVHREESK